MEIKIDGDIKIMPKTTRRKIDGKLSFKARVEYLSKKAMK